VLLTALKSMGLIQTTPEGKITSSPDARAHLNSREPYYVGDYLGLAADSPEVLDLVERLRTNRPADIDNQGAAFIYRSGVKSAMNQSELARHFTLSLAGRARNVAPALAQKLDLTGVDHLVDVAGGTGIYALALLEKHPNLEITLVDLPEVINIAKDITHQHPNRHRLNLEEGNMFEWTPHTSAQAFLFSNIFHDWDIPECQHLIHHYANMLPKGGRIIIHDVFLHDALDGPLPLALYSAALFTLTEGRAYAGNEYRTWLEKEGLQATHPVPTAVHCGIIEGIRNEPSLQ